MYDIIKYILSNLGFTFLVLVFILCIVNEIIEHIDSWRSTHGA